MLEPHCPKYMVSSWYPILCLPRPTMPLTELIYVRHGTHWLLWRVWKWLTEMLVFAYGVAREICETCETCAVVGELHSSALSIAANPSWTRVHFGEKKDEKNETYSYIYIYICHGEPLGCAFMCLRTQVHGILWRVGNTMWQCRLLPMPCTCPALQKISA